MLKTRSLRVLVLTPTCQQEASPPSPTSLFDSPILGANIGTPKGQKRGDEEGQQGPFSIVLSAFLTTKRTYSEHLEPSSCLKEAVPPPDQGRAQDCRSCKRTKEPTGCDDLVIGNGVSGVFFPEKRKERKNSLASHIRGEKKQQRDVHEGTLKAFVEGGEKD